MGLLLFAKVMKATEIDCINKIDVWTQC